MLGEKVDPARPAVAVDGRPIAGAGVATSTSRSTSRPASPRPSSDRHAPRTVDRPRPAGARPADARLYPVGRLDQDSEGLILLTNDGDWAEHVLHPRYGVEREYAVGLARPLTREQAEALERGVELAEGVAAVQLPPRARPAPRTGGSPTCSSRRRTARLTWVRVTIHQGWKRQLRRMFGEVGAPVRRLVRVRIGTLRLDTMASGDVRRLTAAEVRRLGGSRKA